MWPNSQRRNSAKAAIDNAVHKAFVLAGSHSGVRLAVEDLLQHVRVRTSLLRRLRSVVEMRHGVSNGS